MEYCCHVWSGGDNCYLELLDKVQKRICSMVGPSLTDSCEPLAHRRNLASLRLFYRYYFVSYSDRLNDFSVTILRCYKESSFFPCTARLWNSLPLECFL